MNRSMLVPTVAGMIALAIAGCTGSTGGIAKTEPSSSSSSASATVTNTLLEPHPTPTDNNNGTSFDPCLAYSADELKSWGVMPGSVKDLGIGDTIQRGCRWSGDGWELQQLVIDRPVDDYLNQQLFAGSEAVMIEGLKAVKWRDEADPQRVCHVELPSEKSAVGVLVGVNSPQAMKAIPDACDKALSIAADVAKKLPK
ncbi:Protein of uncharacterised function (DUF3558) [Mycobacteroides abscessus subsp. abscessus]|uniref:DUF3558 family protein n=1 Tax=Mycobacteroides abscessus TaxID=36809 RepID=UPI0009270798|nr:Protein of uncharacterised function (DUF3558) [Mycobacteroides abscessus subsp. abscessus]SLC99961.1 Protein of uncharacterised function (DUF3558) [Mycobacteroides abscessus subsp. abscessus]